MRMIDSDTGQLSAAEQTRLSWARPILDFKDVPAIYQPVFRVYFREGDTFPYTLLTPSFAGFLRPVREKLVCCGEAMLLIFEKQSDRVDLTAYKFEEINRVEVGRVLLDSWLTIRGLNGQGRFGTTTLKFNTVGESLFLPILAKLRARVSDLSGSESDMQSERARFDYLSRLNYKFMNYGRRSLCAGDRISSIILQPEKRKSILRIFRKSFSLQVFPAHLLILTDSELINIRDANKNDSYGGIWDYIPLEKLHEVMVREENDRILLQLEFPGDDRIGIPFEPSLKTEIEVVQTEIRSKLKR